MGKRAFQRIFLLLNNRMAYDEMGKDKDRSALHCYTFQSTGEKARMDQILSI